MDTINLIPSQELKEEPISQFLKWSETAGKVIVVLVEAVVLIVFLARFKLDAQILDLKQTITAKAQLVQSLQGFEAQFKGVQKNLNLATELSKQLFLPLSILTLIEENIPQDVFLIQEEITPQKTTLRGSSESYNSISTFWKNLQSDMAATQNKQVALTSLGRESVSNTTPEQQSTSLITFTLETQEIKSKPKAETKEELGSEQTPEPSPTIIK